TGHDSADRDTWFICGKQLPQINAHRLFDPKSRRHEVEEDTSLKKKIRRNQNGLQTTAIADGGHSMCIWRRAFRQLGTGGDENRKRAKPAWRVSERLQESHAR